MATRTAAGISLLLTGWLLAATPSLAFEFHVFRSGMTVRAVLDAAERADLPVRPAGASSKAARFDPRLVRPHQDTATEFSYQASISQRPTKVTLYFGEGDRRLCALSLRWGGVGRSTPFAREVLQRLEDRYGRGKSSKEFLRERTSWRYGKDELVLLSSSGSVELWYVDRTVLPATARAEDVPPGMRVLRPASMPMAFPVLPTFDLRWIIALAVLLGLVRAVPRHPAVKGWVGEGKVRLMLRWGLGEDYAVLNDVTLPSKYGTTQIDHLVLSPSGIFVIETKNMGGAIYGQRWDEHWTQAFGWRKHRFLNPLRQNEGHVRAVREHLGVPEDTVHSIVVFTGGAKFRTEMPGNVIRLGELVPYLRARDARRFSTDEVAKLAARLEEVRLAPGFATRRRHVRHVRERKVRRSRQDFQPQMELPVGGRTTPTQPEVTPACPRCGRATALRVASTPGSQARSFYRCEGFPRCGGTVVVG